MRFIWKVTSCFCIPILTYTSPSSGDLRQRGKGYNAKIEHHSRRRTPSPSGCHLLGLDSSAALRTLLTYSTTDLKKTLGDLGVTVRACSRPMMPSQIFFFFLFLLTLRRHHHAYMIRLVIAPFFINDGSHFHEWFLSSPF